MQHLDEMGLTLLKIVILIKWIYIQYIAIYIQYTANIKCHNDMANWVIFLSLYFLNRQWLELIINQYLK